MIFVVYGHVAVAVVELHQELLPLLVWPGELELPAALANLTTSNASTLHQLKYASSQLSITVAANQTELSVQNLSTPITITFPVIYNSSSVIFTASNTLYTQSIDGSKYINVTRRRCAFWQWSTSSAVSVLVCLFVQ